MGENTRYIIFMQNVMRSIQIPYTPISTSGDELGDDRNTSGVVGGGDALRPDDVSPVSMLVTTPAVKASG